MVSAQSHNIAKNSTQVDIHFKKASLVLQYPSGDNLFEKMQNKGKKWRSTNINNTLTGCL